MPSLKDFNFQHWWTLLAAAGSLIAVASIPTKFSLGFIMGLSLLFFGVGEWINRPRRTQKETVKGLQGFRTFDVFPWQFNLFGLIFEIIGVGLFGFSLYLVWLISRQISN